MKPTELPIMDRYSTGSSITKNKIIDVNILVSLTKKTKELVFILKKMSKNLEFL